MPCDCPFRTSIYFFILKELHIQHTFQCFLVHMLGQTHIKMQHRVFRPFSFQFFDGKTFEKVFLPGKIAMQRGGYQRLAESPGRLRKQYLEAPCAIR